MLLFILVSTLAGLFLFHAVVLHFVLGCASTAEESLFGGKDGRGRAEMFKYCLTAVVNVPEWMVPSMTKQDFIHENNEPFLKFKSRRKHADDTILGEEQGKRVFPRGENEKKFFCRHQEYGRRSFALEMCSYVAGRYIDGPGIHAEGFAPELLPSSIGFPSKEGGEYGRSLLLR